ncbi:MAG: hypothetical protein WAU01_06660 [Saprospiraceae bacterium]
MIRFLLYIVLGMIGCSILAAQSNLPLGQWKSHLSYKEGRLITQSSNKIIYASAKGIFTIDKDDLSVDFISKEDGISDVDVSGLYYDKSNSQLIIVYTNNNIDIMKGSDIINIPFIETNTSIFGSKSVNDFYIATDKEAYIATDFGILGFDLKNLEFPFTTFTQLKINSIVTLGEKLYAGSEEGLYSIDIKGKNISDFNIWRHHKDNEGIPQIGNIKSLAVKYNQLFVLVNNSVYKMSSDGKFSLIYTPPRPNDIINYLSEEGSELMIGIENSNNGRTIFLSQSGTTTEGANGCINRVVYAVEDEKSRVWYADLWEPVKYTEGKISGSCKNLVFPVPFTNDASNIRFKKDKAYVASNGVTEDYQYKFTRYGFYTLEDNQWINFNQNNIPKIIETDFLNLFNIAPHPKTNEVYLGSYYNGIISYDENTKATEHWNKDNSILQAVVGDEARTRIAGLTFDNDDNLWISNFGSPKPLVVKTKDNTWHSFSVPGSTQLAEISVDQRGNKWIVVVGVGNGILVFNEGTKIADPTDDKMRYITKNNSILSGNKVNCVVTDLDGDVWVGTDQGPVVFDCSDPLDDVCRGKNRQVVVEGIAALLLRAEDILCIEIDGANRKWFGTRNGIFVQSPDGSTQIFKFDVKNSPLLDNKVTDLSFNVLSGEMFIVTPGGIQSYRTETTSGGRSHSSNVYAFPNPVRPDYTGPIAIKGLVRDANVKITDVNGRLVYETTALGGQAIWDGNDYNGKRAATGVYLVFSASEYTSASPEALVSKILIVQ